HPPGRRPRGTHAVHPAPGPADRRQDRRTRRDPRRLRDRPGSFRMRATTRIESVTARRKGLVVTELPYGLGAERLSAAVKPQVQGRLLAILDIDEVIQLIRGSDDAQQARERLMQVFDLTDIQTSYILDMPLRRLTRFSKLELDRERGELEEAIAGLDAILED